MLRLTDYGLHSQGAGTNGYRMPVHLLESVTFQSESLVYIEVNLTEDLILK